jgi:hypothetical protein
MEWVVTLEAKSGWGEVETIDVGGLERPFVGPTAGEVGLTLAEGKDLLGELARLFLQTQIEEFTAYARVCADCLKLRRLGDQRTRKVQKLFGTITVDAPRMTCPWQRQISHESDERSTRGYPTSGPSDDTLACGGMPGHSHEQRFVRVRPH